MTKKLTSFIDEIMKDLDSQGKITRIPRKEAYKIFNNIDLDLQKFYKETQRKFYQSEIEASKIIIY